MLLLGPKQNIFELIVNLKCLKQSQSLSIQFKTKNLQNKFKGYTSVEKYDFSLLV